MPHDAPPETALYAPVKALLEARGFAVKAEIGAADVVGVRDGDIVIVELKRAFSLALLRQAVARQALTDAVYVAVPRPATRAGRAALRENVKLCRRLGLGVLLVAPGTGHVEALCDPGPYRPRAAPRRRTALLREFENRRGDPNCGGATGKRMTAYRQDALLCAAHLAAQGPAKAAAVAAATAVTRARRIMADNHYGWFAREARGVYALTDPGAAALRDQGDGAA
jgi:hypothetical protein